MEHSCGFIKTFLIAIANLVAYTNSIKVGKKPSHVHIGHVNKAEEFSRSMITNNGYENRVTLIKFYINDKC